MDYLTLDQLSIYPKGFIIYILRKQINNIINKINYFYTMNYNPNNLNNNKTFVSLITDFYIMYTLCNIKVSDIRNIDKYIKFYIECKKYLDDIYKNIKNEVK